MGGDALHCMHHAYNASMDVAPLALSTAHSHRTIVQYFNTAPLLVTMLWLYTIAFLMVKGVVVCEQSQHTLFKGRQSIKI